MSEHDQQVSGVEATANPAPSQGRRRLVKGLIIATPAILTVNRGFAQSISSLQDVEEAQDALCASASFVDWLNDSGNINEPTPALSSFIGKWGKNQIPTQCP